MSEQLHPGKAAMNGLLAALLAQGGFTGAEGILEGEKGFFRATSHDSDESRCVEKLGDDFLFERNSLKHHASCGDTHSAIDATLLATGGMPMSAGDLEIVEVRVYQAAIDLLGTVEPKTPYLAKFNLPFCIATALRYGRVGLEAFSPERLKDPALLALMPRIKVVSDPALTKGFPRKWPAKAEIHTRDGRLLRGENEYPKGDPENPLSEEEVIRKFRGLVDGLAPGEAAEAMVEAVMSLERNPDVAQLLGVSGQG